MKEDKRLLGPMVADTEEWKQEENSWNPICLGYWYIVCLVLNVCHCCLGDGPQSEVTSLSVYLGLNPMVLTQAKFLLKSMGVLPELRLSKDIRIGR